MEYNYKELEWNISKKDKYNDLIIKQMEAQELYNDLLDKAQQDLFKEDEVSHQDKDKDFEQDQDDFTISTFDPNKFLEAINEETVTKKEERTSSTSLKTYVSAEALDSKVFSLINRVITETVTMKLTLKCYNVVYCIVRMKHMINV